MRKYQTTLAFGFVGFFCFATACGDDGGGTPSSNEAGKSGAGAGSGGGGSGGGGKPSAGNGGMTSSNGGEPMGDAGEPSGNGGQTAGDGGMASSDGGMASSDGGEPSGGTPPGGSPSGNGGDAAGHGGAAAGAGGASDGGPAECTPITLSPFGQARVELSYAIYATSFTPNIVTAADDDFRVAMQGLPYDGDKTGTFDLTQNGDDNYKTCARCLLVYADNGKKVFYPSAGTLEIAPESKALGGSMDATITNLTLVEVTIADDLTSTPVPNGACLTVASATVQVQAPPCGGFECNNGYCLDSSAFECDEQINCPDDSDEFPTNPSCEPVWLCWPSYYGDGDCDCGCGIQDVDCTSTTDKNECEYCSACQGNLNVCGDNQVDPADTTQCL
jgi:hypothetical protein